MHFQAFFGSKILCFGSNRERTERKNTVSRCERISVTLKGRKHTDREFVVSVEKGRTEKTKWPCFANQEEEQNVFLIVLIKGFELELFEKKKCICKYT